MSDFEEVDEKPRLPDLQFSIAALEEKRRRDLEEAHKHQTQPCCVLLDRNEVQKYLSESKLKEPAGLKTTRKKSRNIQKSPSNGQIKCPLGRESSRIKSKNTPSVDSNHENELLTVGSRFKQFLLKNNIGVNSVQVAPNEERKEKTKTIICKYCGVEITCTDKREVAHHLRYNHKLHKFCITCNNFFESHNKFVSHKYFCFKNKNFKCNFCRKRFELKSNLKQHIVNVHLKIDSLIDEALKIRLTDMKFQVKNLKFVVFCPTCNVDYPYLNYFKHHFKYCKKIYNCTNKFNCICPFCSATVYDFNMGDHLKKHLLAFAHKSDSCKKCGFLFLCKMNATMHASNHIKKIIKPKSCGSSTNIQYRKSFNASTSKPIKPVVKTEFININSVNPIDILQQDMKEEKESEIILGLDDFPTFNNHVSLNSQIDCKKEEEIPVKLSRSGKKQLKDIEEFIMYLKNNSKLEEGSNVYCGTCCVALPCESFLKHLVTCDTDFCCSLCLNSSSRTRTKVQGIDHIKLHFRKNNVVSSLCRMCDTTFVNEYNMALHAQYEHFL